MGPIAPAEDQSEKQSRGTSIDDYFDGLQVLHIAHAKSLEPVGEPDCLVLRATQTIPSKSAGCVGEAVWIAARRESPD